MVVYQGSLSLPQRFCMWTYHPKEGYSCMPQFLRKCFPAAEVHFSKVKFFWAACAYRYTPETGKNHMPIAGICPYMSLRIFPQAHKGCCVLIFWRKFGPLILFLCECKREREGCYCSRPSWVPWQQSCSVVSQALACNKC